MRIKGLWTSSFLHPNPPVEKDGKVKHEMKPLSHGHGHGSGVTIPGAIQEEGEKVLIEKLEKIQLQDERDKTAILERSQRKIETLERGGKSHASSFQDAQVIAESRSENEKVIPWKKRTTITSERSKEEDAEERLQGVPFKKRKPDYYTDWQEVRDEVLGGYKSFLQMLQDDETDPEDVAAKAMGNSVGIIEPSDVLLSLRRSEERSIPETSLADNAIRDVVIYPDVDPTQVHESIGTKEVGEQEGNVEKNQIHDKFHNIDMRLVLGPGRQYDMDYCSYEESYNFGEELKKPLGGTTIQTAFSQESQEIPINEEENDKEDEGKEEEMPMVKGIRSGGRSRRTDFSFATFPLIGGIAPRSHKLVAEVKKADTDHDNFYSKVKTGSRTARRRKREQIGLWIAEKQEMLKPKAREEEEGEKRVRKVKKTRSLKELLEKTPIIDIWI